jgi:hypothetical protein
MDTDRLGGLYPFLLPNQGNSILEFRTEIGVVIHLLKVTLDVQPDFHY